MPEIESTMKTDINGITPKEAGKRLDLTPTRIRQLMAEGRLAFVWTPLRRLVDPDSVETIRQRREGMTEQNQ